MYPPRFYGPQPVLNPEYMTNAQADAIIAARPFYGHYYGDRKKPYLGYVRRKYPGQYVKKTKRCRNGYKQLKVCKKQTCKSGCSKRKTRRKPKYTAAQRKAYNALKNAPGLVYAPGSTDVHFGVEDLAMALGNVSTF